MVPIVLALLIALVLAVTVMSCVSDFRTMRIPNMHSAIVLAAFAVAFILSPESFGPWWNPLGAFALMFAVTFGMYAAGMIGSGDTKLGSVLAAWVGLKGLVVFLLCMSLTGGVLGIAALWMKRKKPFENPPEGSWVQRVQSGKSAVPYGIAITVGAWAALFHTGFIHHAMDEVLKIIH